MNVTFCFCILGVNFVVPRLPRIAPKKKVYRGSKPTFSPVKRNLTTIEVEHRLDLVNKYVQKFVNILEIEDLKIIGENESVILKQKGEYVGAVIREAEWPF